MILHEEKIYTIDNIDEMLHQIPNTDLVKKKEFIDKDNRALGKEKIEYHNLVGAYDTETSSFYEKICNKMEKRALTYAFMLGIEGYVVLCREWWEFTEIMVRVKKYFDLNEKRRLIIYVHHLGYEFQFFRKRFEITDLFACDERTPLYCVTKDGFKFVDSLILSALSLEKTAEGLKKYEVRKQVGKLDYSLLRHSKTPLTPDEVSYCVYDVFTLMAYIDEKRDEHGGDITKILLTNTGYVRKFVGDRCRENKGYHKMMRMLTISGRSEMMMLVRAFAGGFTHGSFVNVGKTHKNARSFDLISAYPAVALYKKFPMSRGYKRDIKSNKQFWFFVYNYCCVFDVTFEYIESKDDAPDHYISKSKCVELDGSEWNDNGRIVKAKKIKMTVTDVDFKIIMKHYRCKKWYVGEFYTYKRGYLPKEIVCAIIELYKNKTTLKGIEAELELYLKSKGMLNSVYGMMVTAILKDLIKYQNGEWEREDVNVEETIENYNNDHSRFLFYPWGIFITAYVREIIWGAIDECGFDYLYSDTDSVKFLNWEKHREYFVRFNNNVVAQLKEAMKFHGIEYEGNCNPKTIKGEEKVIGVFENDGVYDKFKFLGAKRYLTESDGKIELTCAGVGKKPALAYMKTLSGDIFEDVFNDSLKIPAGHTGKSTSTYVDLECGGIVTDYLGNVGEYHELSFIHMEPAQYELKINDEYEEFLNYIGGCYEKYKY